MWFSCLGRAKATQEDCQSIWKSLPQHGSSLHDEIILKSCYKKLKLIFTLLGIIVALITFSTLSDIKDSLFTDGVDKRGKIFIFHVKKNTYYKTYDKKALFINKWLGDKSKSPTSNRRTDTYWSHYIKKIFSISREDTLIYFCKQQLSKI